MNANTVKLTVRLPAGIHQRLQRRAQEENRSLNQVVVDAVDLLLQKGFEYPQLSEYDRTIQILRENNMLDPVGSEFDQYLSGEPLMTADEIREALGDIPPVSEIVIADRGER
jgi:hypothetical protein